MIVERLQALRYGSNASAWRCIFLLPISSWSHVGRPNPYVRDQAALTQGISERGFPAL